MNMQRKPLNLQELEAEDADETDDDYKEMTEEQIKENLITFSAIKLADIVIANRYLGLYKNLAIDAMAELGKRRVGGDSFQYEVYIEDKLKELPKLDFSLPALGSLFDQIRTFKK